MVSIRTNSSDESYYTHSRDGISDEVGLAGAVESGAGAVLLVVVGGLGYSTNKACG